MGGPHHDGDPGGPLSLDGRRRRRRSLATAVGVTVLAAGALAGSVTTTPATTASASSPASSPAPLHATTGPTPGPTTSPAPPAPGAAAGSAAPAVPGAASSAGRPGRPGKPEAHVPTRIAVPAVGIDAGVTVYTDAMVRANGGWVDPPDRFAAAWWSGGGAPQSHPTNTVYVYGHVSRLAAVFNALHRVDEGDTVRLTTAAGTLTYRVTDVPSPILKTALRTDPRITAAVPGRLVLVGCYRAPDQGARPTTKNFVVIAQQVS